MIVWEFFLVALMLGATGGLLWRALFRRRYPGSLFLFPADSLPPELDRIATELRGLQPFPEGDDDPVYYGVVHKRDVKMLFRIAHGHWFYHRPVPFLPGWLLVAFYTQAGGGEA